MWIAVTGFWPRILIQNKFIHIIEDCFLIHIFCNHDRKFYYPLLHVVHVDHTIYFLCLHESFLYTSLNVLTSFSPFSITKISRDKCMCKDIWGIKASFRYLFFIFSGQIAYLWPYYRIIVWNSLWINNYPSQPQHDSFMFVELAHTLRCSILTKPFLLNQCRSTIFTPWPELRHIGISQL